jgi:hypothetical protein
VAVHTFPLTVKHKTVRHKILMHATMQQHFSIYPRDRGHISTPTIEVSGRISGRMSI